MNVFPDRLSDKVRRGNHVQKVRQPRNTHVVLVAYPITAGAARLKCKPRNQSLTFSCSSFFVNSFYEKLGKLVILIQRNLLQLNLFLTIMLRLGLRLAANFSLYKMLFK